MSSFEMDWFGLAIPEPALASDLGPCLWLGELAIQGWWRRIRENNNPVSIEARWHPGRQTEIAAVLGGRPNGSGQYPTTEAFNAEVFPLIRAAHGSGSTAIQSIAERLRPGGSHTTAGHRSVRGPRKQFRAAGYETWADVIAAALKPAMTD